MKRRVWSFKVWPVLVSAGAAAVAMAPAGARAQVDVNPPLPNVLLLLDTSGSLERMTDRTELPTEGALNNCLPANYEMNRWATVVNALTGTVLNPSCEPIDRNSASFRSEYGTNVFGADPYDYNYYLPFHRIASGNPSSCVMSPVGATFNPANWWLFPSGSIVPTNPAFGACANPNGFEQDSDGIIDTFGGRVRFGLMTFDPLTEPDTDEIGTFSYWYRPTGGDNWASNNQSSVGWPLACTTRLDMEVGARNPSAPPWEGRLMGFGDYDIDFAAVQANNDNVQAAILGMRPYGATPIAGMMSDAEEFLRNDDSTIAPGGNAHDPTDVRQSLSAKDDPYWDLDPSVSFQCRKTFIVLVSDGEPNLDLRPDCDTAPGDCDTYPGIPDGAPPNTGGCCPFDTPSTTAARLALSGGSGRDVDTFVIGVGLSQITADLSFPVDGSGITVVDCNDIVDDSVPPPGYLVSAGGTFQLGGICNRTGVDDAVVGLEACCALSSIAFNGDTERAYFPLNIDDLKATFSQVLDDIAAGSTGRTHPVFNNVRLRSFQDYDFGRVINGYQVLSSLEAPLGQELWRGNLERKRYDCSSGIAADPLPIDLAEGDDFGRNLNNNLPGRRYWSVNPDKSSGTAYPRRSIRPNLAVPDDDGMGVYGSEDLAGNTDLDFLAGHIGNMYEESLELAPAFPTMCDNTLEAAGNAALCKARLLEWNAGSDVVLASTNYLRGDALGAIYHSTPTIIGPPSALVRDESFSTYAEAEAGMPTMLYTGTTDGQLHAFIVQLNSNPADAVPFIWPSQAGTDTDQNELWSFMPPMVLPGLAGSFNQQSILLDGVPVVQDVVFDRDQAGAIGGAATWNRVLVMAGGATASANSYYYALDVTNPRIPKFLWQLSTSDSDEPLFGKKTPTPAITNLSIDIGGARKEVAVAILAGGAGTAVDPAVSCSRGDTGATAAPPGAPYTPRSDVRCWENTAASGVPSGASGRSVTIVRLDTGEVLMSMRAEVAEGPGGMTSCPASPCNMMDVQFDSPMTGEPVAFPGGTGAVASRIYVGDEDGTLWRIDVSDPAPQNWNVEIAWDTFYDQGFDGGHQIPNAPITSVDEVGDTVLLFSTGDQEVFGYTALQVQRVVSLTDVPTGGAFDPLLNWQETLLDGERVTGPMVLFDSVAYFATFKPNSLPTCEFGNAKVWGLDYRKPTPLTTPPEGLAKFDDLGVLVKNISEPEGTVVFGLAAVQVPSCTASAAVFDYYNPEARLSAVDEGAFQLVYSTGKGGAAVGNDKTKSTTITLPTPQPFLRIDSYASIIE